MNPEQEPRPEVAEAHETLRDDDPRIYVASLSDYNAGRLHGTWLNANQEPEAIQDQINQMLSRSPEPTAEEWAIHDHEGFGPLRLGEYESIEHVSQIAQGIAEHGMAFAHWADYLESNQWEHLDHFEDAFIGEWRSTVEFAESFLEDTGVDIESLVEEHLQPYVTFDLDAYARDLSYDFHIAQGGDGVYVFDNT